MTDGAPLAHRQGLSLGHMQHAIVLDIRLLTDGDAVYVGSERGMKPYADPIAELGIPDDIGRRCNITVSSNCRLGPIVSCYHANAPLLWIEPYSVISV